MLNFLNLKICSSKNVFCLKRAFHETVLLLSHINQVLYFKGFIQCLTIFKMLSVFSYLIYIHVINNQAICNAF